MKWQKLLVVQKLVIYRKLKRDEVILVDSEWKEYTSYSADLAQEDCDLRATNKGPNLKIQNDFEIVEQVEQIEEKILINKWSSDAIIMDLRKMYTLIRRFILKRN